MPRLRAQRKFAYPSAIGIGLRFDGLSEAEAKEWMPQAQKHFASAGGNRCARVGLRCFSKRITGPPRPLRPPPFACGTPSVRSVVCAQLCASIIKLCPVDELRDGPASSALSLQRCNAAMPPCTRILSLLGDRHSIAHEPCEPWEAMGRADRRCGR